MAIDVTKFIGRFVEEARDHLNRLNDGVAALERGDTEIIHAIFRSAHTIKGSARMLKLTTLSETAHKLEDLLGALREKSILFSPPLSGLLHQGIDTLSALVELLAVSPDSSRLPPLDEALCSALAQAASGTPAVPTPQDPPPPPSASTGDPPLPEPQLKTAETVRVRLEKLDDLIKLMGELISSHDVLRQRLVEINALTPQGAQEHSPLHHIGRRLQEDLLTQQGLMDELHDKSLQLRMLPLAILFEPAARMTRDLGRSIGKQVECHIHGGEIELDRMLIDKLSDPVIHLIRNAIDHGLETPEARIANHKPPQGRITLTARQDGRWVVIEIADDGVGIPIEKVREQAVKKELVSAQNAAMLSEREIIDFLFFPGFSTKSRISELSGRGVGLDVVKQCVLHDLQGSISIANQPGRGATFTLRLPLSLAMMRVLLVESQGLTFGITAPHVAKLVRQPQETLMTVAERQVVIMDNEFIPIASLADLLRIPARWAKPLPTPSANGLLLVVLQVNNEKIALQVNRLQDERDMVIHPLPPALRTLSLVSGIVICGQHQLVTVLNAPSLFELARRHRPRVAHTPAEKIPNRILVVDDSLNTREIEKEVLQAHGYQVTLAEDGLDGLRKALEGQFDAVLTDVEMPEMDGFALTARLRQESQYRDTPIIIITSRAKEEDRRRGLQAGADRYIVKGDFNQNNLVETLRTLLG